MIVVAILGILAAVAIPKFSDLLIKSKESTVKGSLGSVRSALSIYYSDVGDYPSDVTVGLTTNSHYMAEIPLVTIPAVLANSNPGHSAATGAKNVVTVDDDVPNGVFAYMNSTSLGLLAINCSHMDTKGTVWSAY
jgi:general secretion pathway protein G